MCANPELGLRPAPPRLTLASGRGSSRLMLGGGAAKMQKSVPILGLKASKNFFTARRDLEETLGSSSRLFELPAEFWVSFSEFF